MDSSVGKANELDKDAEVKKLQELVKKLELQNEELRSEQQALLSNNKNEIINNSGDKLNSLSGSQNLSKNFEKENSLLDSLYLESNCRLSIVLDDRELSDDETWLMKTTKDSKKTEWLDNAKSSTISNSKNSLLKQLEGMKNSPRTSQCHNSSSSTLSPDLSPNVRGDIDTRTFVRPKKRKPLDIGLNSDHQAIYENDNSGMKYDDRLEPHRRIMRSASGSLGSEEEDRMSSASDCSYSSFLLADVEDVNAVARLQEESLKFSDPIHHGRGVSDSRGRYCGIPAPPKAVGSSGNSTGSSQEDLLSPPPRMSTYSGAANRNSETSGISSRLPGNRYAPSRTFGLRARREGSDLSTPPDSPYNSQQHLEYSYNGRAGQVNSSNRVSNAGRMDNIRSMGNPNNASYQRVGTSSHPPPPVGRIVPVESSSGPSRPSRLQNPQPRPSRLSAPSPVRVHPSAVSRLPSRQNREPVLSAHVSAQVTSGLPRPGSKLQAPRSRALSQSPLKFSAAKIDWREGCY